VRRPPSSEAGTGIIFKLRIRGISHATIKAKDDRLTLVTNGFSETASGQIVSGPVSSRIT
jgi:hypothetical protein